MSEFIIIEGATEHNLKNVDVKITRGKITVVTGVSGSGKSSLVFDTILAEAQRRFFYTLSHYSRQFLDIGSRPAVRKISGLSPSIALAQNETLPSKRATVGTLTDLSELVAVCYARFGEQRCPDHNALTSAQPVSAIVDRMLKDQDGQTVAICAPVVESKKGVFKAQLTGFAERGFLRVWIDGQILPLTPLPELAREEKHTIKVIVDVLKVKDTGRERLIRSIETATKEGQGYGEYFVAKSLQEIDIAKGGRFSTGGGCPTCGFSWPRLDARYFSANSLGKCKICNGFGATGEAGSTEDDVVTESSSVDVDQAPDDSLGLPDVCIGCEGTGIDASMGAIRLHERKIQEILNLPIREVRSFFKDLADTKGSSNPALNRVTEEMNGTLARIDEMGLGYLSLGRRVRSLSGGESQRLKLAGILAESLRGVLYILDEPSQGLHPTEIDTLWQQLVRLRDLGNTVIVVDHDEALMRRADAIIDLGPGGGARGGQLMGAFTPATAGKYTGTSATARWLSTGKKISKAKRTTAVASIPKTLEFTDLGLHNLKVPKVQIPMGAMTAITGVSGAGKSSFAIGTVFANAHAAAQAVTKGLKWHGTGKPVGAIKPKWINCSGFSGWEQLQRAELIDRRPVAKSSVSMPASYLEIFTDIRELFAKLPEAQIAGLTARSFSLNAVGGRCEVCKGRGEVNLTMRFLADARVRCSVCNGRRYRPVLEDIRYNTFNIADVLEMTIDQALDLFTHHRKISSKLRPAVELGLGYLKLGQTTASLSGGEAQRLKILPYLTQKHGDGHLLILDEPTTGLHFEDVQKLLTCLRAIVESGATVLLIEHNIDVILSSDWMLELGPGAADKGGKLIYSGLPEASSASKKSIIGPFMKIGALVKP